jgi:predicted anti-sigma-YlaC factor YlaD
MKKKTSCEFESKIANDSALEHQSDDLKAHLSVCEECRETFRIARWIQSFAEADPQPPSLPAPGLLWWKAQLLEKRSRARQATQLISLTSLQP